MSTLTSLCFFMTGWSIGTPLRAPAGGMTEAGCDRGFPRATCRRKQAAPPQNAASSKASRKPVRQRAEQHPEEVTFAYRLKAQTPSEALGTATEFPVQRHVHLCCHWHPGWTRMNATSRSHSRSFLTPVLKVMLRSGSSLYEPLTKK